METLKFSTKIMKKDISLESNDTVVAPITLKWEARIVLTSSSISDIVAHVPDQDILVSIVRFDEKTEQDVEEDITVHLINAEIEYDRSNVGESKALGLLPIEISIYKGKATVKFCAYAT
jgi:hypothetical protein